MVARSDLLRTLVLCAFLAGCMTADPNSAFKDTPASWGLWKDGIDSAIRAEKAGRPGPGLQTWETYWRGIQTTLSTRTRSGEYQYEGPYLYEHADRYIKYIVDQRRAVGLPDIPFYPKDP